MTVKMPKTEPQPSSWFRKIVAGVALFSTLLVTLLLIPLVDSLGVEVAPNGNDNNPGMDAVPVRTLERAQAAVGVEKDERLHSDGNGWRLDQAKVEDKSRPRVLLVGDSILSGYFGYVKAELQGKVYMDAWINPYYQSETMSKLLGEVLDKGPYDVVHINTGLHGWPKGRIKEGTFEPLTKAMIEVIRIKCPKAKIIWANSTPVTTKAPEPMALNTEINPNIIEQNRMAAKVMAEMNVPVNDFYSLLVNKLDLARGDQFHWKKEAYVILGKACETSIKNAVKELMGDEGQALNVQSPDGNFVVEFTLSDGAPVYSVSYQGKPILTKSHLGLVFDGKTLTNGLKLVSHQTSQHDETWKPVYGERSTIRDHYRQLVVNLDRLQLTFRAYDEGVAFCYTIPKQPDMDRVTIAKEQTEFRFPADHTTWAVYFAQGNYQQVPLSKIEPGCERPLPIQVADDIYLAIGEAKLVDYARMKLAPLKDVPHALVSDLSSKVTAALPLTTPWRFIMAAESPGRLLENNFLVLNLNDPCAIADTSWIKPGKVIREVSLTTVGGKACVDFAVKRGLQYVEFDAGWYGYEYDDKSDARAVNLDPKRSKGPLDLHEVIRYGKERGIGIILYVNRRALEHQLDEILPLYEKWGVKGVKYGFVNVGSQQWTSWLHEAIRKAAAHHLMVDVHDEYRPTGYTRTYPNFMTQEGISGDEASPSNTQTLILQFSRFIAGAADNTICYYNARVDKNATHAYQLAKAVCLYSPWQFLFWYDRPSSSPRNPGGVGEGAPVTGEEPELEFYNHCPTVWDDTKVLLGRIGEYSVIARRSGAEWFIGFMNSGDTRSFDVPLDFLEPGKKYTAHIYSDDPAVPTRTQVKIERKPAEQGTTLPLKAANNGGVAVWIAPQ